MSRDAVDHDQGPSRRDHERAARANRHRADTAEVEDGDLLAGGEVPDPRAVIEACGAEILLPGRGRVKLPL